MTYAESEKIIRNIRSRHEIMFRMAVSHLMDVGIRNLTEEAVKATCEEIRNEDDSNSFMTNDFKCDLVQLAGELAKIDHVHLLVYISRHVSFDVGDYKPSYERTGELLRNCAIYIVDQTSSEPYYALSHGCDFEENELEFVGMSDLIPNNTDEESFETCPVCGAAIDPRDGEENGYGDLRMYWSCVECGTSGYAEIDMQNGNEFVGHVY